MNKKLRRCEQAPATRSSPYNPTKIAWTASCRWRSFAVTLLLCSLSTTCLANPLTTQAVIKPQQEVTLSSEIQGKIKNIPFTAGEKFKKGQVLISFDCTVNKAQLQKAEAKLTLSKKAHQANVKLRRMNAVSDTELAGTESELKTAKANVAIQSHIVNMCNIKAPFAGEITKLHVKPHQSISQGNTLVDIIDTQQFRVELIVPSSWLKWLKTGTAFNVKIDENNKTYHARVTHIVSKIDAISQTVNVIAEITGDQQGLLAGMSGTAVFKGPTNE